MLSLTKDENDLYKGVFHALRDGNRAAGRFLAIERAFGVIHVRRVLAWFEVFEFHRPKVVFVYDDLVNALLELYGKHEAFADQSRDEFERSCYFLSFALDKHNSFTFQNRRAAKALLIMAVFYGKYASLQVKSIKSVFKPYPWLLKEGDVITAFRELFSSHPENVSAASYLLELKYSDWDFLAFCCQGNNPRKYADLPLKISKREAQVLMRHNPLEKISRRVDTELLQGMLLEIRSSRVVPEPLNEPVLRSLVLAKFLARAEDKLEFFQAFFDQHKTFYDYLDRFCFVEMPYWLRAYEIMSKGWKDGDQLSGIRHLLDYLSHNIRNGVESLKGRTLNSLRREMDQWHQQQYELKVQADLKRSWKPIQKKTWQKEIDGVEYQIQELSSGKELYEEGKVLRHCVFSYLSSCEQGYCRIFSLRFKDAEMVEFERLATLELVKGKLSQVSGMRNRDMKTELRGVLEEWGDEMNSKSSNG